METVRSLCSCLPLMDVVCLKTTFDPLGVLDGRPNYANIAFSELFYGCRANRSEVMDEGPDYATALLSKFCAGARCPPALVLSGVAASVAQS